MATSPQESSIAPPRLIQSVIAGFNTVATNIFLLVLPVGLDLFLWLGPQLRLQGLLAPFVEETTQYMLRVNPAEMAGSLTMVSEIWNSILDQFNMAIFLRTFPIGIPSLMSSKEMLGTPLGDPIMVEIGSILNAFLFLVFFLSCGFILGCLYFNLLSRKTAENPISFDLKDFGLQTIHSFILTIGLFGLLIFLSIPAIFIVTIIATINPGLANFVLLFLLFIILWLLIPLVFTPHIIFSGQRNLIVTVLTSVRLVRSFLPGTGLFILVALLIAQGLDVLWRIPPSNSWMTLIGIFGHAFIYTSLLAASFVYFRGGLRWMIQNLQKMDQRTAQA